MAPVTVEDAMLQSMEDASPPKWHLAHTTWFFEQFILRPHQPGYQSPDDRLSTLFNSYYVQAGPRHTRGKRGLISRPSLEEVWQYRHHVEDALLRLLETGSEDVHSLTELGCHHEMQHQELLVTDLLHGLSFNSLLPAYQPEADLPAAPAIEMSWIPYTGGTVRIGHKGDGFSFDCEGPAHPVLLGDYALANRLVTNGDWIAFMEDGGYTNAPLWLSDGWTTVEQQRWDPPLYWWQQGGIWWSFTLHGPRPVDLNAPVVHVSYYEAEAFARWAGARLPTEAEWEHAAAGTAIDSTFLESGALRPMGGTSLWGDVWIWTSSAYSPYPGFRAPDGAIGEYNGKFMINQMVLRGGSCATPKQQMRASYRTFFHPDKR
jgi:ergothioneine biosynthesis protein EgtB